VSEILTWLDGIGLAQYAKVFETNDIDISLLAQVDDQVLKDIGISSAGHRLRIRNAIANLTATSRPPTASESKEAKAPAVDHPLGHARNAEQAQLSGERRHVAVMFCDLVDSTGIAAKLDAEEWRDLVGSYLDAASAAVTEMGGKVAKKLGDGLMALFGYPVAQENDAERAVRAALAIQRSLAELNRKNEGTSKPLLAARIAIDLGPVVVDAAGEIFGDVPNVAARAQAVAEPDSVVVTQRVQRQVSGLFVAEDRGSHDLKGVPEAVTLFRIVRASGGGRRAGQRHLTPLVGRDEEIAMLMRRWERACLGDGQLVQIVGEPGLGKSRLIEEFHNRLRETPHTWVEWSCSQLLQNTALHPITEWGRQRFGGVDVSAELRLADLENSLTQAKLDTAEIVPLLAPLLDIPLPKDRTLTSTPEELRRRQLAALTGWVTAGARVQPVVLAVEDMHWADPTTLDVSRSVAERATLAPLFVLMTSRPEFRAPWSTRSHHATISLSPLDRHQVRHMVSELAARHALPKEVIEGVTERSGGVPLFVEEVTRLLLERGEQGSIQAIPPTLQQSLTARLDKLGPDRDVAQIGAVIGRDFSYALLRSVAGIEDEPLQAALEGLAESDILLVRGVPPNSEYRFKHGLIQEAAYENLLKTRRQTLHRRVAEVLLDQFAAAEPELLAHHFTQAGLTEAAVEWWGRAGHRSFGHFALLEAGKHFTRALEQVATLSITPALRQEQITLQVMLMQTLMHVRGYAAPETKLAAERAHLLIEQAKARGEPPEDEWVVFSVLQGSFAANLNAFNGDAMRELAAQYLSLAEKHGGPGQRMIGYGLTGQSLVYTGDIANGRAHLDRAIALCDPSQDRAVSIDSVVTNLNVRSFSLWFLGYPDGALADADKAISVARKSDKPATLLQALTFAEVVYFLSGDYSKSISLSDEQILLADKMGAWYWKMFGIVGRGHVPALTGDASSGIQMLTAGISAIRSAGGATVSFPINLSWLAVAQSETGHFDEAWGCIDEAITLTKTTKEKWFEAEVLRIAGEVALKSPEREEAEAETFFERALAVARQQQAKSWELRAAMSMARLWRDRGKRNEARELLAPVYGWFTEGFDTLDLKEAKALLDELQS
jgi:class 3 adenylate cyclase/tetratricopeptide (TPR) repeat protein